MDRLADFKLNSGVGGITKSALCCDEISPDNCRLWDVSTNEIMDKDRFRRDLGSVEEATRKSPGGSAFFRKAERPLTWTARR